MNRIIISIEVRDHGGKEANIHRHRRTEQSDYV